MVIEIDSKSAEFASGFAEKESKLTDKPSYSAGLGSKRRETVSGFAMIISKPEYGKNRNQFLHLDKYAIFCKTSCAREPGVVFFYQLNFKYESRCH
ncbi:hypothetical protein DDZ16_01620 [Marinilabilia rubra]|uniref:Uncharacterized protein n=1 Tax=Marinilabilia rubra TaxID=2162893 RepID=A0A2U2BDS0_9BACT|nr:hypothetical protein DDZ16_01620 [Marinilabilia rubra]